MKASACWAMSATLLTSAQTALALEPIAPKSQTKISNEDLLDKSFPEETQTTENQSGIKRPTIINKLKIKKVAAPQAQVPNADQPGSSTATTLLKNSSSVQYAVNMQDGGLILTEASDSTQNVKRTYRSRSLDHGYFGMGWCSDFESKLLFQGRGVVRLVNCQSSRPAQFVLTPSASSYVNEDQASDQIFIKLGQYERRIHNDIVAKYNFKGQIIEYKKNGQTFKVNYNARSLPALIQSKKYSLKLDWHPVLDLIEKTETNAVKTELKYSGFNLIEVKNAKEKIEYEYDDLDNLIKRQQNTELKSKAGDRTKASIESNVRALDSIDAENKSAKQKADQTNQILISYDTQADRVLKIEGHCIELYGYKKPSARQKLATVSKLCSNEASRKEFRFEYAQNSTQPTSIQVVEKPILKLDRLSLMNGENL